MTNLDTLTDAGTWEDEHPNTTEATTLSTIDDHVAEPDPPQPEIKRSPAEIAAFENVVASHHKALVSYISARMHTPDGAEDLAQLIYMRTWLSKTFDPIRAQENGAWKWFEKSAKNALANYHRDHARRPQVALNVENLYESENPPTRPHMPVDMERDPYDIVAIREELGLALSGLHHLSHKRRSAIVLRAMGLQMEEIGEILGISQGAAKVLVYRAQQQLTETLNKDAA